MTTARKVIPISRVCTRCANEIPPEDWFAHPKECKGRAKDDKQRGCPVCKEDFLPHKEWSGNKIWRHLFTHYERNDEVTA